MKPFHRAALLLLLLLLTLSSVAAWSFSFNMGSPKWPGASTLIFTGIPGTSASGVPWSVAMRQAADEWNASTAFSFASSSEYRDPCAGTYRGSRADFLNGADFRTSLCGRRLSDSTLAVTVYFTENNILGSADIVEADIVFNANLEFDVYDGPLRFTRDSTVFDFRRIALHELGHVLGLSHDNSYAAIMNTHIGEVFSLQPDDIKGVNSLYSGINNCALAGTGFGWKFGALENGDCRVRQLMAGGTDSSFVDVYQLEVANDMTVNVDISTDGRLNAVLFLATDKLGNFYADEASAGNCLPALSQPLTAGQYVVLVNTYVDNVPCNLASSGNYRLSISYQSPSLIALNGQQSFQGGISSARFSGGISVDGGVSYGNRVRPDQAFDAIGRIEIDPRHQGQPGFITVAAITHTGETLIQNAQGEFVAYQPEVQLVPVTRRKILGEVEHIDIFRQFKARSLGIDSISVDFLIGYGVDSNPDELYYHQQPLNLLVE